MADGRHTGPSGAQSLDPSLQHRLSDRGGGPQTTDHASDSSSYDFPQQAAETQQQFTHGQPFTPGQYDSAAPSHASRAFTMLGMAGALPDYTAQRQPQHDRPRLPAGALVTDLGYHSQETPQFASQVPMNNNSGYHTFQTQYSSPYSSAHGQPYPQTSPSHFGGQNHSHGPYTNSPYFINPAPQSISYYPGQFRQVGQGSQYVSSFGQGSSQAYSHGFPGSYGYGSTTPTYKSGIGTSIGRSHPNVSSGIIPSSPRGPPRKPRQSGHALWVGNLPSGALINDLKDHFSRDASKDIESLFLISKSNCAFVNYRTEAACAAAMTRFHDSRFHGVRLVCRLRRTPASSSTGVPLGPVALVPSIVQSQTAIESIAQNREISSRAEELAKGGPNHDANCPVKRADKYFIMKSLTVEDMELSLQNSIWATQAHNEDALNKAFETSENVYLIFSANKSGEYFGVARMASRIDEESATQLDWAPRAAAIVDDPDLPRSIPTPATEHAPKGRIIDDSARGTIFWEADPEDDELARLVDSEVSHDEESKSDESGEEAEQRQASMGSQAFGRPFKIEWISTNRLPFYRTRGLRNPWNANREVKIARDGTELETSVGRRLLQMFQGKFTTQDPPLPAPWPLTGPF